MISISEKKEPFFSQVKSIIYRLRLFIGIWFAIPFFVYGLFTALALSRWNTSLIVDSLYRILYGIIISLVSLWWIFIVNDYFDAPYDVHSPRKRARNYFCEQNYRQNSLFIGSTLFLPLVICIIFSLLLGLDILLISLGVFFLGYFYSSPPLRFKEVPIIDIVSHGIYVGAYFFLIGTTALIPLIDLINEPLFLILLFFTFIDGAWLQIISQLLDYPVDLKGSQRTTSVWLGKQRSLYLMKVIIVCLLISLPLFLIFNNNLWLNFSPRFLLVVLIISFIPSVIYLWHVHADVEHYRKMVIRSGWHRMFFTYPFAIISVLLINPLILWDVLL